MYYETSVLPGENLLHVMRNDHECISEDQSKSINNQGKSIQRLVLSKRSSSALKQRRAVDQVYPTTFTKWRRRKPRIVRHQQHQVRRAHLLSRPGKPGADKDGGRNERRYIAAMLNATGCQ